MLDGNSLVNPLLDHVDEARAATWCPYFTLVGDMIEGGPALSRLVCMFRSQIWMFSLFSLAICIFTLEHHSDLKQRRSHFFLSQRDCVNFASFGRMTQCGATLVLHSLVSLRIFSAKFIDSSVKSIQREEVLSHRGTLAKCSKVVRWCFDVSFVLHFHA